MDDLKFMEIDEDAFLKAFTMPPNDKGFGQLAKGYKKYGHRFARKKRQMKKNRKKYNMTWKLGQVAYRIGVDKALLGNDCPSSFVHPPWQVHILRGYRNYYSTVR